MEYEKVQAPALALQLVGVIGLLVQLLSLTANFFGTGFSMFGNLYHQHFSRAMRGLVSGTLGIFSSLIGLALAVVVILWAQKMKELKDYNLAIAASILVMVPCLSPCCILGLPVGIWSLLVLTQPEVKAAFS